MQQYEILAWDSDFFGFPVANILTDTLSSSEFISLCSDFAKHAVKLAYWKTHHDISLADFKTYSIRLVDKPCLYKKQLNPSLAQPAFKEGIFLYSDIHVSNKLYEIAIQCGAFSRFQNDTRIPKGKYEELYRIWIEKSVGKQNADDIICYSYNNEIAGIVTISILNDIGTIGLFGVDEIARGRGIGTQLLDAVQIYCIQRNCFEIRVATQQQNIPACSVYKKVGFNMMDKKNCYHIWKKD